MALRNVIYLIVEIFKFAYMENNEIIICYLFVFKFTVHKVIKLWQTMGLLNKEKLLRFAT